MQAEAPVLALDLTTKVYLLPACELNTLTLIFQRSRAKLS